MNVSSGAVAAAATIVTAVAFFACSLWAWLPRHRRSHDGLSRLPAADVAPAQNAQVVADAPSVTAEEFRA